MLEEKVGEQRSLRRVNGWRGVSWSDIWEFMLEKCVPSVFAHTCIPLTRSSDWLGNVKLEDHSRDLQPSSGSDLNLRRHDRQSLWRLVPGYSELRSDKHQKTSLKIIHKFGYAVDWSLLEYDGTMTSWHGLFLHIKCGALVLDYQPGYLRLVV